MPDSLTEKITSLNPTDNYIDHAFFGILDEGVIITNKKREVLQVNRAATRLLGLDSNELIGQKWPDYLQITYRDGGPVPKEQIPVHLTLAKGLREETESFNLIRKDGSSFPAKITTAPINADNKVEGVAIVFWDLTKEIEFEKAKIEFVSLASHQLKGPLTGIKWYLEILLKQESQNMTKKQIEYLVDIDKMNKSLIQMINSLLNISRVESGRIMINPENTDLKTLFDEVINEQQKELESKDLKLDLEFAKDLPTIMVDPRMIKHVFMNLLTNAMKYSNIGGKIEISMNIQGSVIAVAVKDHGIGIPKDQRHKIFQKFFRAHNAVQKETDGTGLGLYLAKAIVESSRGRIWFESEEGNGTTFWVTLPLEGVPARQGEVNLSD